MNPAYKWAAKRGACQPALDWLATLPDDATMSDAWRRCKRSDWMTWALEKAGYSDERVLRLYGASCAARALREWAAWRDRNDVDAHGYLVNERAQSDGTYKGNLSDIMNGVTRVSDLSPSSEALNSFFGRVVNH